MGPRDGEAQSSEPHNDAAALADRWWHYYSALLHHIAPVDELEASAEALQLRETFLISPEAP